MQVNVTQHFPNRIIEFPKLTQRCQESSQRSPGCVERLSTRSSLERIFISSQFSVSVLSESDVQSGASPPSHESPTPCQDTFQYCIDIWRTHIYAQLYIVLKFCQYDAPIMLGFVSFHIKIDIQTMGFCFHPKAKKMKQRAVEATDRKSKAFFKINMF